MNARILFIALVFSLLPACSSLDSRRELAQSIAVQASLARAIIATGRFHILAYYRITDKDRPATIYIEGDGHAFVARNLVSPNPTPANPESLRLAALDPSANVVYLARPCQYVRLENESGCRDEYWTVKRYSREVIDAMNSAIDKLKQAHAFTGVRLVGYSGGATVAALLATVRKDVLDLRTLAGNLDTSAFTRFHRVTPLLGSLNPAAMAGRLYRIPQLHLFGGRDSVITPAIRDGYLDAVRRFDKRLRCVQVRNYPEVSHAQGWQAVWSRMQYARVGCKAE